MLLLGQSMKKEANKIIDDIIRYAKSIDKQAKVVRKDIKKEEAYIYAFFTISIKTIKYRELETFIKSKYSTNKFDSRPAYGIHPGYANEALEVYYMSSYKKKIKDATWKRDNEVYYKFERGYWHVFSIYNRNKMDATDVVNLARRLNVNIAPYDRYRYKRTDKGGYYEDYIVKGKDKNAVIKFCETLNPQVAHLKFEDSTDKWVIKNTGLAYEIWNQSKMVKKFPTKKQAIEWIHSRFPTDEITEDSTKDGRLWSTLTRKAKHR